MDRAEERDFILIPEINSSVICPEVDEQSSRHKCKHKGRGSSQRVTTLGKNSEAPGGKKKCSS